MLSVRVVECFDVFNPKCVCVSRLYILETPELCLSEYDSWFHTFVLNISGSSCIGLNTNVGGGTSFESK